MKYKSNTNEVWQGKEIIAAKMVRGKWSEFNNAIPFLAVRNKLKIDEVLKKITSDCPKFKFKKNQIEFMNEWHQNNYDTLLKEKIVA